MVTQVNNTLLHTVLVHMLYTHNRVIYTQINTHTHDSDTSTNNQDKTDIHHINVFWCKPPYFEVIDIN